MQLKAPVRLTEMTAFQSSGVMFSIRLSLMMPALLTRTSMRPCSWAMLSIQVLAAIGR